MARVSRPSAEEVKSFSPSARPCVLTSRTARGAGSPSHPSSQQGLPLLCPINPFIKPHQEGAEPQPGVSPAHAPGSCCTSPGAISPGTGLPPRYRPASAAPSVTGARWQRANGALMRQLCCFFEDVVLSAGALQRVAAYRYVKRKKPAASFSESGIRGAG